METPCPQTPGPTVTALKAQIPKVGHWKKQHLLSPLGFQTSSFLSTGYSINGHCFKRYPETEPNNILKKSYTMNKWALSQECKDSLISANQSMGYTTLTN